MPIVQPIRIVVYELATGRVMVSNCHPAETTDEQVTGGDASLGVIRLETTSNFPRAADLWVEDGEIVDIDQADQATVEAALLPGKISQAERFVDSAYGGKLGAVASSQPEILTIYPRKEAQARAYLADPPASPVTADWPWLAAEVGATTPDTGDPAVDLAAAATLIVAMADAWEAYAAACESVRLSAKAQARAAVTRADVQTILDNLSWPALPAE